VFSLLPPLSQVVEIGFNHAPAKRMRSTFRKLACSEIDSYGLRMESGFLRNCPLRPALCFKLNDLFVSCVPACPSLTLLSFRCEWLWRQRRMSFSMFGAQTGDNSADRRVLPCQECFQACHGIHMQMEAINNVQGMGSSASNCLGKGETAVSRDDLHIGMLAKPGRYRFLFAVGQERYKPMRFQVYKDRAIPTPFCPRKIVHANHSWSPHRTGSMS
jgi:hypothetical protein